MNEISSVVECKEVTDHYPQYFTFDEELYFSDPRNYCVKSGMNLGFGEYKSEGVYEVHLCLHTARGREAVEMTKQMLDHLYQNRPLKTAIAFIEVNNKRAKWLIRQVGFTSLGLMTTKNGLCEMFYQNSKVN